MVCTVPAGSVTGMAGAGPALDELVMTAAAAPSLGIRHTTVARKLLRLVMPS